MRLLLSGGGTAGHVLPHIAVLDALRKRGEQVEVLYVGSRNGPEQSYAREWGIPYKSIPVGKWRRYFDWKNLTDPLKVGAGVIKSLWIIQRFKPDVIFSKGGFVSVPILLAGHWLRVPIIIHDSDAVPGLTTRLTARWATKICLGYEAAAVYLPQKVQSKIVVTGIPIRKELLKANAATGRKLAHFNAKKPIVLIMGGSLGAASINRAVQASLPKLTRLAQILHVAGTGKATLRASSSYRPYEYVGSELVHFYAMADVVVMRAGANSLAELETLGKPMILIPLGQDVSHGDQMVNAELLRERGAAIVIQDHELTGAYLEKELTILLKSPQVLKKMSTRAQSDFHKKAAMEIAALILQEAP